MLRDLGFKGFRVSGFRVPGRTFSCEQCRKVAGNSSCSLRQLGIYTTETLNLGTPLVHWDLYDPTAHGGDRMPPRWCLSLVMSRNVCWLGVSTIPRVRPATTSWYGLGFRGLGLLVSSSLRHD